MKVNKEQLRGIIREAVKSRLARLNEVEELGQCNVDKKTIDKIGIIVTRQQIETLINEELQDILAQRNL